IRRVRELGLEVPPNIEKGELKAIVEEAEKSQLAWTRFAASPGSSACASTMLLPSDKKVSVAELKARLRELGLEVPTNIVEKSELVALVEEAERQHSKASPSNSKAPHLKIELLAPWSQQESRSMPGRFYFVNQETGSRTWEPWFRQESRSSPGRFYFINALTGESTWEPPTRHWKEVTAETHSPSALKKIPQVTNEEFEPPEPCSVDYRDEAFSDSNRIIVATPAMKSTNSGPGLGTILSCSHGSQGVKSLSMAALVDDWEQSLSTMAGKSFPPVADCVIGSQLTWVKGPLIGRGSLGRVFKAADQQTGRILAVKEIPINTMDQRDEQFKQQLENEVSIMKDLRHPHIVAYLGHDYLDQCLYMYLEHMPGGTITQALHEFGPFEESLTAKYSRQILEGLDYLHTRDPPVIHRDIKGSNILIGDGSVVKLADFGCSKRTDETLTHTMRGSIPWMDGSRSARALPLRACS
ncbi:unnamed protein product, partial [Polarella glacialis]